MADRVLRTIREHDLIPAGTRVLVALSGGPDSVTLAHVLHQLAADHRFFLVGLAHLNHSLRGAAADEDELFCGDVAMSLNLPLAVGHEDVRRLAYEAHGSIEDAGRRARRRFLTEVAARFRADRIALGHTRDDQAETFLLKLFRGAGRLGLAGIYPRHGRFIRPLLDVRRADILAYLGQGKLSFREDESNRDLSNPRNRIRHELIPLLESRYSPRVVDALARTAAIARDEADWLEEQAEGAIGRILTIGRDRVEINVIVLSAERPALARRIVRRALEAAAPGRFVGFGHVEDLLRLARQTGSASLDLPGLQASLEEGRISLTKRVGRVSGLATTASAPVSLSIPGEARLAGGWIIGAAWDEQRGSTSAACGHGLVQVQADQLRGPLAVRYRRPGDRFRPIGLNGRKKLQDLFVDRKVPRAERDHIPLVVDARDRIVWVVGHGVAHDFRVVAPERGVITLTAKQLGGPG